eukprot:CCRYP_004895-RA/>CCRYP_004895-RA protein AED:0.28 eAED:0.28 QI:0/-1/0/1/-1/1/1/0/182
MRNSTNVSPLSSRWFLFSCLGCIFLLSALINVSGAIETEETSMEFPTIPLRPTLTDQGNPVLAIVETDGVSNNDEPETEANDMEKQMDKTIRTTFLRNPIRPLVNDGKDDMGNHAKSAGESRTGREETETQEDEEYDYESFHSKFDIPAPALRATLMATVKISLPEQEEKPIDSKDHHVDDF